LAAGLQFLQKLAHGLDLIQASIQLLHLALGDLFPALGNRRGRQKAREELLDFL
jgi:hypothetical protein